jgi:two-component system chemotaxis response regulator CheB
MTKDEPIRVLIVDDSSLARHRLSTIISGSPGFEVAGVACNGSECLTLLQSLRPDVITLDVQMPTVDGLTTLKMIMEQRSTPVLMVSSLTESGARTTVDALTLGAVDYIAKPSVPWRQGTSFGDELIAKLAMAARVRVQPASRQHQGARTERAVIMQPQEPAVPNAGSLDHPSTTRLVIVGSSTGGPQALDRLFGGISGSLRAAFIVVQHMPPLFTKSLAGRLGRLTPMPTREVEEGDQVRSGTVLVAPGGFHTTLGIDGRFHLDQTPPVHGVRPAIDRTLSSVADHWTGQCLVVILTGMGTDGTDGARRLHARGAEILAQDENTSIVYGMPRSIAEAGIAKAVLPLDQISTAIEQWMASAAPLALS